MSIYMKISRLDRIVTMVARGHLIADEIDAATKELVKVDLPHFGTIIDVSAATSELTMEQVEKVASLLRGTAGSLPRGPAAFVINPERVGFAHAFAEVAMDDRPVTLFRRLQDARDWIMQEQTSGPSARLGQIAAEALAEHRAKPEPSGYQNKFWRRHPESRRPSIVSYRERF